MQVTALVGGALLGASDDREGGDQHQPGASLQPGHGAKAPLRVLIVEDEAIVAMSLGAVVEQFGHEVVGSVATGRGAIAEAARLAPDVVLMDVRLADSIDGISAGERMLAERAVRLIFITAYSDLVTLERIRELGAPVLSKPVAAEALRKALAAVRPPEDPSSGRERGTA